MKNLNEYLVESKESKCFDVFITQIKNVDSMHIEMIHHRKKHCIMIIENSTEEINMYQYDKIDELIELLDSEQFIEDLTLLKDVHDGNEFSLKNYHEDGLMIMKLW